MHDEQNNITLFRYFWIIKLFTLPVGPAQSNDEGN